MGIKIEGPRRLPSGKWLCACSTCGMDREVSYQTAWEIRTGRITGQCRRCAYDRRKRESPQVKKKRHPVTCPRCQRDRAVSYRTRAAIRSGSASGWCLPCTKAKRAEAAAPLHVAVTCPSCQRERTISRASAHDIAIGRTTGQCPPCAMASRESQRAVKPYPKPQPPRRLTFDLAEILTAYRGPVTVCPTADLREPQPIPAPLPSGGLGFEGGVLVPTVDPVVAIEELQF